MRRKNDELEGTETSYEPKQMPREAAANSKPPKELDSLERDLIDMADSSWNTDGRCVWPRILVRGIP